MPGQQNCKISYDWQTDMFWFWQVLKMKHNNLYPCGHFQTLIFHGWLILWLNHNLFLRFSSLSVEWSKLIILTCFILQQLSAEVKSIKNSVSRWIITNNFSRIAQSLFCWEKNRRNNFKLIILSSSLRENIVEDISNSIWESIEGKNALLQTSPERKL